MASDLANELSGTQVVELVTRLGKAGLTAENVKKLIGNDEEMAEFVKNGLTKSPYRTIPALGAYRRYAARREGRDLIEVSSLPAVELVEFARKELALTYLDEDFAKWDFITDEHGKTYEMHMWKPGREVISAAAVREQFTGGFVGNTAAFIAWLISCNPEGYYASIPENGALFQRGSDLYVPRFFRDRGDRELSLHDSRSKWRGNWCFVAFREIPTD